MKMNHQLLALFLTVASATVPNLTAEEADPNRVPKLLVRYEIAKAPDVEASWLFLLQLLSEGKSWEDAMALKQNDPASVATYASLTPDARKKLAGNFVGKINDKKAFGEIEMELRKQEEQRRDAVLALSPEDARKFLIGAIEEMAEIKANNLIFLKRLADGKSWTDAKGGRSQDPETYGTYAALTPDARAKLAVNFVRQIKDAAALPKLAKDVSEDLEGHRARVEENRARGSTAPSPVPAVPAVPAKELDPDKVLGDARKFLIDATAEMGDLGAGDLLLLKELASGKSLTDAKEGKRQDKETYQAYRILTPDARLKLGVSFIGKINDAGSLSKLLAEFSDILADYRARKNPAKTGPAPSSRTPVVPSVPAKEPNPDNPAGEDDRKGLEEARKRLEDARKRLIEGQEKNRPTAPADPSVPGKKPASENDASGALSPDDARKMVIGAIEEIGEMKPRNLLLLKRLAGGQTWEDAEAAEPDTLATYESLSVPARLKLAVNFLGKITDGGDLNRLAQLLSPRLEQHRAEKKAILPGRPQAK